MRESEYKRLETIFREGEVPEPAKTYEVIAAQNREPMAKSFSDLKLQMHMSLIGQPSANAPRARSSKEPAYYQDLIKQISKYHRQHILNYASVLGHHKKISSICMRELRRGLSKTSKTNPNLKNKRINKELQRLISRTQREEKDKMRKEDAAAEIKKRNEEVLKEELRQKRKFNYLMSQTEAFASFFLNKQAREDGSEEGLKAARDHLAHVREFDGSPKGGKRGAEAEEAASVADGEPVYVHKVVGQPKILQTRLREYQLKGLNWLVNLYNQGINGILADDMGLGKTVQAISLLGYLAETEDVWGPFLIVTPASTLHNWENEFSKFIPDFRVVVYYGNIQERADLRRRFKKANVVVTSYQVAVSDESILRKIKWQYMILDEAQAIKSNSSQRWKILLGFKARNRCLLTGTPIQNNMQELWSLLHFIMPTLFDSLGEFSDWFLTENRVDESQVSKLHTILKPFMLRRHKDDIKDEIGTKEIFNVYCDFSPRQRILNEEILGAPYGCGEADRGKNEYENTIMHLKKVCNHPDLFEKLEPRSALHFAVEGEGSLAEHRGYFKRYISSQMCMRNSACTRGGRHAMRKAVLLERLAQRRCLAAALVRMLDDAVAGGARSATADEPGTCEKSQQRDSIEVVSIRGRKLREIDGSLAEDIARRRNRIENHAHRFIFAIEKVANGAATSNLRQEMRSHHLGCVGEQRPSLRFFNRMTFVPPLNTFISDSGKLVELDALLKRLKLEGHRPLVYFQMTRMMDLFEEYLVRMEYSYLRLDGSSKISTRKELVKEWQSRDIFIFILSTRAGGVGINLTAADTVIFYDSDWNPTVDQQAMDRVHRLGQTKNVSVYRLITRGSIEERIMERANKKDEMQKIVIKGNVFEGNYS